MPAALVAAAAAAAGYPTDGSKRQITRVLVVRMACMYSPLKFAIQINVHASKDLRRSEHTFQVSGLYASYRALALNAMGIHAKYRGHLSKIPRGYATHIPGIHAKPAPDIHARTSTRYLRTDLHAKHMPVGVYQVFTH